ILKTRSNSYVQSADITIGAPNSVLEGLYLHLPLLCLVQSNIIGPRQFHKVAGCGANDLMVFCWSSESEPVLCGTGNWPGVYVFIHSPLAVLSAAEEYMARNVHQLGLWACRRRGIYLETAGWSPCGSHTIHHTADPHIHQDTGG